MQFWGEKRSLLHGMKYEESQYLFWLHEQYILSFLSLQSFNMGSLQMKILEKVILYSRMGIIPQWRRVKNYIQSRDYIQEKRTHRWDS